MSENLDEHKTAIRIIEAGTPERCTGCQTPLLNGFHLAEQVLAETITEEGAIQALNKDLEDKCKFGRSRTPRFLGGKCMYQVVCMPASVPIHPDRLKWDWGTPTSPNQD